MGSAVSSLFLAALIIATVPHNGSGFNAISVNSHVTTISRVSLASTQKKVIGGEAEGSFDDPSTLQEEAAVQWGLFNKYHAEKDREWWGTWSTYSYMGDVEDSSVVGASLQPNDELTSVTHKQHILSSSIQSECETCFSSSEVTTLPTIATYTSESFGQRHRCAAAGMVVGPSLLKSGVMSTELALRHGDGRIRVVFQHAPVWERGIDPGSCPPNGLKLFRTIVSKEKLRLASAVANAEGYGPPSAAEEKAHPPSTGNPVFFRPVPPFLWHAKWSGRSWTWGPQMGDRGWSIQEMEEADAWHGRPAGDATGTWSLRLPGGVLIQCPRVVISGMAGICRLAWLPEDDGVAGTAGDGYRAKLLRVEASVAALDPIVSEEDDNMMVGFYPPSLGSLRTDMLEKTGELEGVSLTERAEAAEGYVWEDAGGAENAQKATSNVTPDEEVFVPEAIKETKSAPIDEKMKNKIDADSRNALDL